MNANELADIQAFKTEELTIWERNTTATMLRQQQERLTKYELRHAEQRKRIDELEHQQQSEIEALKELNTMLKDAIEKRIGMDAERYKWLRAEFAAGRETYLAEGMPSGESLDKYIDGKLK